MENSTNTQPSIMAVSLKYGMFLAIASILIFVLQVVFGMNPMQRDWKGWISICISIGLVVLAHKEFKDKGDGYMTYGQGFGITFTAVMISMLIGMIFTYLYVNFIDPHIMDEVYEKVAEDMEAKKQSQESIDIAVSWTKKLFWPFYFIGGAFVAALIGLIVPIFTQKKNPAPTYL